MEADSRTLGAVEQKFKIFNIWHAHLWLDGSNSKRYSRINLISDILYTGPKFSHAGKSFFTSKRHYFKVPAWIKPKRLEDQCRASKPHPIAVQDQVIWHLGRSREYVA